MGGDCPVVGCGCTVLADDGREPGAACADAASRLLSAFCRAFSSLSRCRCSASSRFMRYSSSIRSRLALSSTSKGLTISTAAALSTLATIIKVAKPSFEIFMPRLRLRSGGRVVPR
jgi:hypothetical protein